MMPIFIDAFLVLLNHFLSAMMFVITKFAVSTAPSFFLVTWRMLVSGIVTFGAYGIWKGVQLRLTRFDWALITALGLTNMVGKSTLNFWAIQFVSSSKANFINSLNPFVSAFFAYLIFKEEFSVQKYIGLFIGLLGFVYYFRVENGAELHSFILWLSWPEIALLGAVFCNSISFILIRYLSKERKVNALLFNSLSMLVGSLVCVPVLYSFVPNPHIYEGKVYDFIFLFILLMLDFVVTLQLKAHNLTKFRVTFMTFTASCMVPLIGKILDYYIVGKPITQDFFIAYSIVFVGLYIFYREELKQGYIL